MSEFLSPGLFFVGAWLLLAVLQGFWGWRREVSALRAGRFLCLVQELKRRWPPGEDGGSRTGRRSDGGGFIGSSRFVRCWTTNLGLDPQHGVVPRSTSHIDLRSSVWGASSSTRKADATATVLVQAQSSVEKTVCRVLQGPFRFFLLLGGFSAKVLDFMFLPVSSDSFRVCVVWACTGLFY